MILQHRMAELKQSLVNITTETDAPGSQTLASRMRVQQSSISSELYSRLEEDYRIKKKEKELTDPKKRVRTGSYFVSTGSGLGGAASAGRRT